MKSFKIFIVGLILVLIACKEHYVPEATTINNNILVVEGFINTGADSTIIKLSKTVILGNKKIVNPEIGATLSVETSTNETKLLVETEKGIYAAPALNFGSNKKYRLNIRTKNGTTYQSDFVDAIVSPQIDSINYQVKPDGLQLYVNTSDPNNKTHYYRWEYEEDWIFYASYNALSIWLGGPYAVDRDPSESVFKCWGKAYSSVIVLGSTIKLSKDVIHLGPLTEIESTSEKLSEKYSILVKQYALTKEAYEFWQSLKKNTESLGSIFDVLPSQLIGNIRNVANVNEPVIGYINAGTTQKQRIYIRKDKLPKWTVKPVYGCSLPDSIPLVKEKAAFFSPQYGPVVEYRDLVENKIIGHLAARRECTDCTIRGTVKQPSFWQ